MKNLNITYDDEDFQKLKAKRNEHPECKNWEEFILKVAGVNDTIQKDISGEI
jgi:hypothetical protein